MRRYTGITGIEGEEPQGVFTNYYAVDKDLEAETAKDYKVEILPEDSNGIAERAEKERQNGVKALEKLDILLKKEGRTAEKKEYDKAETSGSQSFTFTAAASEKLAQVCPEEYTNKVEVTEKDIEISKKRFERDIKDAVPAKTKSGLEKVAEINAKNALAAQQEANGAVVLTKEETKKLIKEMIDSKQSWSTDMTKEEAKKLIDTMIASEKSWITAFQKSYWVDIMGKEKMKENGLEVTKEEWYGMVEDLKNKIEIDDYHNVIPRAGHMNNLLPEKFKTEVLPLLQTEKAKKGILKEIDTLQYGSPKEEGKRRNANPWELASRIRYVLEFMPELKDEIKLTEKGWKDMKDKLEDYRKEGNYQSVAYQLCNMKIIEKAGLARF